MLHTVENLKSLPKLLYQVYLINRNQNNPKLEHYFFGKMAFRKHNGFSNLSLHVVFFRVFVSITILFGIVACTFSDNLSRNSCILLAGNVVVSR